ncbi:hypothetical protein C8A06_0204 [Microbacteriaceae bacterium MWH-Ta3]|nr:hypothetical protein C8A06_0204 [Microbacteriaceae bacterium MWH-Ta3]
MARRNRRDRGDDEPLDIDRIRGGMRRTEFKRGESWIVQSISAERAQKDYVCPGCTVMIAPGIPHVVAWHEEGLFGAERAVSDRRHWHTHCWRIH